MKKLLTGLMLAITALVLSAPVAMPYSLDSTIYLRPNATGSVTQLGRLVGPANWQDVDDIVPDDSTTYVIGPSGDYYDLYNLPNTSNNETINSVRVWARCAGQSGGEIAYIRTRTLATNYDSAPITLTTNWIDYSIEYITNPNTGVAWTWPQLDALEVGFHTLTINAFCTQEYAQVNFVSTGTYETGGGAPSGLDIIPTITPKVDPSSAATIIELESDPFYPFVHLVAVDLLGFADTGVGVIWLYRMAILLLGMVGLILVYKFTNHLAFSGIPVVLFSGYGMIKLVWPWWAFLAVILLAIGLAVMEGRQATG